MYEKLCMFENVLIFYKNVFFVKVFSIDVDNEVRIVFFGKIGVGKSVIGNLIFGGKVFKLMVLVFFIISCCSWKLVF